MRKQKGENLFIINYSTYTQACKHLLFTYVKTILCHFEERTYMYFLNYLQKYLLFIQSQSFILQ